MTSPPEEIRVACPECGEVYDDWWRPSINLAIEDFDDEYLDEASSSTCPKCQHKVRHCTLAVREDGTWGPGFAGNVEGEMRGGKFVLRFDQDQIERWAARYSYGQGEDTPQRIGSRAQADGVLTKPDFLELCEWKSHRSKSRCKRNSEEAVREATRFALSTPVEELRIGVLTLLHGVDVRTASAILHFCHNDPYPLLDVRALWSLGFQAPKSYPLDLWLSYVEFCRALAEDAQVSMRTLDRALWQYSKENQNGNGAS